MAEDSRQEEDAETYLGVAAAAAVSDMVAAVAVAVRAAFALLHKRVVVVVFD